MQTAPEGPIREEDALGKAYDARLMRRLLTYLGPYRWHVVGAVAMLIAASALELVGPWLTKVAIDRAIPEGDYGLLGLLGAAFVGSIVLAAALEYVRTLLTTWIGQRVMVDLRRQIFSHLQRLDLAFFDRNPVGRLMTRVTSDVEVLNEMFTSGVVTVFGDVFTVLFIMGAMLLLDWRLALVTFAVLPLVFVAAWVFRTRVRDAYRDIRVRLARINAYLQERIGGMTVVQLFGQEAATRERFEEINDDHLQAHLRSITYYALFFPVVELLSAIALALIIWYGGAQALQGTLTIGIIAAFLQYARRFFRPIQDLSEKYNILQGAMASSERIFRLMDEEPRIRQPARPVHLPHPIRGRIEFEDVWFHYGGGAGEAGMVPEVEAELITARVAAAEDAATDSAAEAGTLSGTAETTPGGGRPGADPRELEHATGPGGDRIGDAVPGSPGAAADDRPRGGDGPAGGSAGSERDWVLRGISFTVQPGQRLAIVGATGAGKSTIINLLMRFYEPLRGRILLDGIDIRNVPLQELRSRMGLVLQDVFLFSGSARDNIGLGRQEVDDERIRAAARRVGVDRYIERLPGGYDQTVGERGGSLSVGERQLVSFARALAGDPAILLLDEATSSVDSEVEAQIERALEELMEGRTSVVVAHRLSTIQNADNILVLHHGEIRETGTHAELLRLGGLYARLYRIQFTAPTAAA